MNGPAPTPEEVVAFLEQYHSARVELIEPLGGGWWSSAWAYETRGEELVVRFGHDASWYEADRMAVAFSGPDLPVPIVREVSVNADGYAFAISDRCHGRFLEATPVELSGRLAMTLTDLLVALHDVPQTGIDSPVRWHQPGAEPCSWREHLLDGLVDDPSELTHGWSASLADRKLDVLASAATARIHLFMEACPERRDLVHGDLLHGNVLVSFDAAAIEGVYSWKCSVRGDFLFDAAWCTFWAPWHDAIAAADPLSGVLGAQSVLADSGALVDAAARHHCYELHIGFTHLGWNIWTGNSTDLDATARRLSEVLERGPLSLPST